MGKRDATPKAKINISIDPELLKWVDEMVAGKHFATRSSGIERAVQHIKEFHEHHIRYV